MPPDRAIRAQRPQLASLAWLVTLVLLTSCGEPPSSRSPWLVSVAESEGDAGTVDPALCAGLDECACSQTPGCAPLTTECWCPPAACGSTADCLCSGGRYLGCNPRGAGCTTGQCGLFAEPSERDERGCLACAQPTDCAAAIARLPAICPATPPVDAQWLCSGAYGPCATICIAQLGTCAGASCALCADCSCGNDLFDSCLSECLSARPGAQ